jgi:GNAT superfamily N-acetyltransferase
MNRGDAYKLLASRLNQLRDEGYEALRPRVGQPARSETVHIKSEPIVIDVEVLSDDHDRGKLRVRATASGPSTWMMERLEESIYIGRKGLDSAVLSNKATNPLEVPQRSTDPILRPARENELPQLLELYRHLHANDLPPPPAGELSALWQSMIRNENLVHIVAEVDGKLVSSCALAIVPNLTRGARAYAVIENVVTHKDYRRRGLGTAVLHHAVDLARSRGCYKVMLLTGSKHPETLRFYERAGFLPNVKTGFVKPLP